jgi:2-isopropylmalate synthase
VHAVTEGIDALGEVTGRVLPKEGAVSFDAQKETPYSRVFGGHGADTDIVVASARAYLNALNKLIVAQTEGSQAVQANYEVMQVG